jgi:NAD(P)-dependent dehydrogenase (short-subunit alcohol dehydrogenase family)
MAIYGEALAAGVIGKAPKLIGIPSSEYPTKAKRPAYSRLDTARFAADFGLRLPDWREGLRQVMELNLWGTMIPTQVFGQAMADTGKGSIVNISSMASQRVITNVLRYTLAKTAIDAYTQWFAVEMANRHGDKLRMNAIAPGFFLTEQNRALLTQPDGRYTDRGNLVLKQTPFKRFGAPEELIGALVYLLSDASKFVNGENIKVYGGFTAFSGV